MTTLLSLRRYTTFDEAELMTMMEGIYSRVEAGDYAENLLIQSVFTERPVFRCTMMTKVKLNLRNYLIYLTIIITTFLWKVSATCSPVA